MRRITLSKLEFEHAVWLAVSTMCVQHPALRLEHGKLMARLLECGSCKPITWEMIAHGFTPVCEMTIGPSYTWELEEQQFQLLIAALEAWKDRVPYLQVGLIDGLCRRLQEKATPGAGE